MQGVSERGLVALRSRDFRLLVMGQAVSITGSQMQQVAVVWQLYLLTHSALSLGMLGFFRVAPVLAFALGGGVVADAFDRRRLLLISQSMLALASVGLAVTTLAGWISPPVIYGLACLAGTANAFDSPARQALISKIVPREHLPNALSLYAMVWQVGRIGGPALGGAMLAWAGVAPIYFIDVVSFLAVIVALLLMRARAARPGTSGVSIRAAVEGLRFLYRTPVIFSTMTLDFLATFFGGSMLLMPIFADQILRVGPTGLGWLYAAEPVGAAVAAAAMASLPPPARRVPVVLIAVVAYGAAVVVFGLSRSFPLSLLALAGAGAADTVSMVIRQTLRQLLTPDALQGRMTSVNLLFVMGGPNLGEVEAGLIAKWLGAPISVWSGGALCIAAAGAMALWLARRGLLHSQPDRQAAAGT